MGRAAAIALAVCASACTFHPPGALSPADTSSSNEDATIFDVVRADAPAADLGSSDVTDPEDAVAIEDRALADAGFEDTGLEQDAGFADDAGFIDDAAIGEDALPGDTADARPIDAGIRDTGLLDRGPIDTGPVDAGPPPPTRIAFSSPSRVAPAGMCSDFVALELRDATGAVAAAPNATRIDLSRVPAGLELHADPACTSPIASVLVPRGGSTAFFHFRGDVAGTATVSANANGLSGASQAEEIIAGPPTTLAFVSPAQTRGVNDCSAAVVVEARDAFGNASAPQADESITVTTNPTGRAQLFADPDCAREATAVTMPGGQARANVYFLGEVQATFELGAMSSFAPRVRQTETIVACDLVCGTCANGCCGVSCPTTGCTVPCSGACPCNVDCNAGGALCSMSCTGSTECRLDCRGVASCQASCSNGSVCVIDCRSASSCNQISCTNGSDCLILCTGAATCDFANCNGGRMSCPGAIVACGRPCP
jgi:hypothetical protein